MQIYFELLEDESTKELVLVPRSQQDELDLVKIVNIRARKPILGFFLGSYAPLRIKKRDRKVFKAMIAPHLTQDGKWFILKGEGE